MDPIYLLGLNMGAMTFANQSTIDIVDQFWQQCPHTVHEINTNDPALCQSWDVSSESIGVLINHQDGTQEIASATLKQYINQWLADVKDLAFIWLVTFPQTYAE